jgi:intracellular multiplication protein IcmG
MADSGENKDEYQFSDLDVLNPELVEEESRKAAARSEKKEPAEGGTNVRRNALIAVGLIILSLLGYKFFGSFFPGKKTAQVEQQAKVPPIGATVPQKPGTAQPGAVQPSAPQPITAQPSTTQPSEVQPSTEQPSTPETATTETTTAEQPQEQAAAPPIQAPVPTTPTEQPVRVPEQAQQKLTTMETNEQNVRSEINSINERLSGINNNVNELVEKMNTLSNTINELAAKVDQQSNAIASLKIREEKRPKPVRAHAVVRQPRHAKYYIQAVIPGRAWLIAGNRSTLTVREGSQIPGYGVVKLIDPNQGRVVTSSGQVIRFSQQDS